MALKDEYFSISEAAKEFGFTRQTIYRWIKDNKISTEKIGGIILINKEEIRNFVAAKSVKFWSGRSDAYIIEALRKQCGYSKNDVIEIDEGEKGMNFIITRKDGASEKVHVGTIKVTMTFNEGENFVHFNNMKLKNINIVKGAKDNKIISESKPKTKEGGDINK